MRRNDWIGLLTSFLVHALLLVTFLFITTTPEPVTAGFLEVEFGPLAQGRPVQQAPEPREEDVETEAEEQVEETPPPEIPDEETKPVDLPDQPEPVVEEEVINTPETDVIAPEQVQPDEVQQDSDTQNESTESTGGGQPEGTDGDESGQDGAGAEEAKTAPFVLEGIDRVPLRTTLPQYVDKVNAIIQVRITVSPKGRIIRVIPVRKGNASLERAVTQVLLQRWQFNPLAPNVPQENQTGTITFRFRLE